MNVDLGLPEIMIFIIEGSFIPALVVSLALPLLKSWNKRNFVFLALLSILFVCDITFFVTQGRTPLYIAVMVIVTMISLIGERVIPAFTVAALRRRVEKAFQTSQNGLDILAFVSLLAIILALLFTGVQGYVLVSTAFASAVIHVAWLRQYQTRRILNDPMVWILQAGYCWVIVGLCCMSMSALGVLPFSTGLHVFTVGAIGSMTLGMICRVTLGHTGRSLIACRMTVASFFLMQVAAFTRILGPIILPEHINLWIISSTFLWSACFGVYVLIYTPILWAPRPDGRAA